MMRSTTVKMNKIIKSTGIRFYTTLIVYPAITTTIFFHMPFRLLFAIVTTPPTTTSTTTRKVVTQGQNTGKSCTLHVPHIALCIPMCTCDVSYNKQKIYIH